MNRMQEAALDRKIDQHFKSHRELPNGRNFLWQSLHEITPDQFNDYRSNFDRVFPNAPGAGI